MSWLQLLVDTRQDTAEPLAERLEELGALSVTFQDNADQPLFEPLPGETPLWEQTRVVALFEADADVEAVIQVLDEAFGEALAARKVQPLEDQDWERSWLDHFQPMVFGEGLWIVPTGFEPPQPGATNIRLDPGLAFGSGTHPTTALCLAWLDRRYRRPEPPLTVIDYGCGSGILAVAAAMLGAQRVIAVDIDPQALTATRDNAERNGVAERIETYGIDDAPQLPADLLIANILANPLVELAPHFKQLVRSDGEVVLSGLLVEQQEAVVAAYEPEILLSEQTQQGDWLCLAGRRKS